MIESSDSISHGLSNRMNDLQHSGDTAGDTKHASMPEFDRLAARRAQWARQGLPTTMARAGAALPVAASLGFSALPMGVKRLGPPGTALRGICDGREGVVESSEESAVFSTGLRDGQAETSDVIPYMGLRRE